jgi:hypothetical protein
MRRGAAAATWAVTIVLDAWMLAVLLFGGFLDQMAEGQDISEVTYAVTMAAIGTIVAVTISYATVGLLVAARVAGSRVAWVLLFGGLSFAAVPFGYIVGGSFVEADPYAPAANLVFLLGPASIPLGYALILPVLALVFPHGDLPSPRWRLPAGLAAGLLGGATVLALLRPGEIAGTPSRNPLGLDAMPDWVANLGNLATGLSVLAVTLLGVVAVITRYRRGSTLERQQLRWFVAAVLLAAVPLSLALLSAEGGPFLLLLAAFGLLLVPVAVGIAVTRYRLYEIDRVISRGLSWGLLTAVLVGVYTAAVLVLQGILGGVTQGQTLAVAASTLLAAALFQPLRRRLQHLLDRRFDRGRYDAERTMELFAERIRNEVDLGTLRADVEATAGRSLRPLAVGLWFRARGRTGR